MIVRESEIENLDLSQSEQKLVVRSAEQSALEASNIMRSFFDQRQRRGSIDLENAAKIDSALEHNKKVMAGNPIARNLIEQQLIIEENKEPAA